MPSFIEGLGQGAAGQAAGGIVGGIMGLALENHNDKRQLKQQRKLQDLEIQGQQKMGLFNYEQQLKMWEATNAKAQMEQIKKAGLNPALMYGNSGPGGTTQISPGNVSGSDAPRGGGEIIAQQGMGIQLALMEAQRKNIEADTKVKEGEAANKPLQGQELVSRIGQIAAQVKNTEAQTEILAIDQALKSIDAEVKGRTIEDQIDIITNTASSAIYDAQRLQRRNQIEAVTAQDTIQQIKAESIGALLENVLTGAQTTNVRAQTQLTKAATATEEEKRFLTKEQSRKLGQEILQGWDSISIDKEKLRSILNQNGIDPGEKVMEGVTRAIDNIIMIRGSMVSPKPKQVDHYHHQMGKY